jgi:hypothetical protein
MRLHNGNKVIGEWSGEKLTEESHVVRLIREACRLASFVEPCLLALDSYFLTVPVLNALIETERQYGGSLISIVTKAKKNAIAYEEPVRKQGKGRPPKKGVKVVLHTLFDSESKSFTRTKAKMYGKHETVEFLVKDLLWGKGLYHKLRFVLVKYDGKEAILVSTDTTLSPESIIEIYALRFKIEGSFRELKQVVAGFAYRFWSSSVPKLKRYGKNQQIDENLRAVHEPKKQAAILSAYNAIQGFAMFSIIAFGLLQIGALRFAKEINESSFRWIRTKRNITPSEATTADFMRKTIFCDFHFSHDFDIALLIRSLKPVSSFDSVA